MADAQLSPDEPFGPCCSKATTSSGNWFPSITSLDEHIQQLASLTYLTDQQQFEEIALKKQKLALKDRIAAILREHHTESPPQARAQ